MKVIDLHRGLGVATLLYLAAIVYVGILSLRSSEAPDVPSVVDYYVTSVSATLATILGMVLLIVGAFTVYLKVQAPRSS
jgi:hypothetical protein